MAQEASVSASCRNETVISIPTGWNGKSGVPPKFVPRIPFAFQPVEPEILAKWKAPGQALVPQISFGLPE